MTAYHDYREEPDVVRAVLALVDDEDIAVTMLPSPSVWHEIERCAFDMKIRALAVPAELLRENAS